MCLPSHYPTIYGGPTKSKALSSSYVKEIAVSHSQIGNAAVEWLQCAVFLLEEKFADERGASTSKGMNGEGLYKDLQIVNGIPWGFRYIIFFNVLLSICLGKGDDGNSFARQIESSKCRHEIKEWMGEASWIHLKSTRWQPQKSTKHWTRRLSDPSSAHSSATHPIKLTFVSWHLLHRPVTPFNCVSLKGSFPSYPSTTLP